MKKWIGTFNYNGEIWKGQTVANTRSYAFQRLTKGMSKKYGTTHRRIRNYFLHKPYCYEIKEVQ